MDVCLTNYGHCNYVSGKHACIFYDEVRGGEGQGRGGRALPATHRGFCSVLWVRGREVGRGGGVFFSSLPVVPGVEGTWCERASCRGYRSRGAVLPFLLRLVTGSAGAGGGGVA